MLTPLSGPTVIRPLTLADCARFPPAFAVQGWDEPEAKFRRYLGEVEAGERAALVAEWAGELGGYVTVLWKSPYEAFRAAGIPEISDLNVLAAYRRRGLATALLDEAERLIAERSPIAGLGVGLYPDYGPAQILYARRGYVPDGRGVCYGGRPVLGGATIRLDDDALLFLTRRLR
jgi:GNAT superfamily N-acetyltransferase